MPCQIIKTANAAAKAAASGATLPARVRDALMTALDDEYHAEATYAAIITRHGEIRPFSNIIKAERRHAAAISTVLKAYGLAVPENGYSSGKLPVDEPAASVGEACAASVSAEEANVDLYNKTLLPAVAGYPGIAALFTELRDSSRDRHLPAFRRCATRSHGAPDLLSKPHGGCRKGGRHAQPKGQ